MTPLWPVLMSPVRQVEQLVPLPLGAALPVCEVLGWEAPQFAAEPQWEERLEEPVVPWRVVRSE